MIIMIIRNDNNDNNNDNNNSNNNDNNNNDNKNSNDNDNDNNDIYSATSDACCFVTLALVIRNVLCGKASYANVSGTVRFNGVEGKICLIECQQCSNSLHLHVGRKL